MGHGHDHGAAHATAAAAHRGRLSLVLAMTGGVARGAHCAVWGTTTRRTASRPEGRTGAG